MRKNPAAEASIKGEDGRRAAPPEISERERGFRRTALKTARALELPPDVLAGSVRIEMSGNREAVVDGCRGVLEYSRESIRLSTGDMKIHFVGRGLELRNLRRDCAIVDGYIISVDFG